jgi:hypothetical protein
MDAQLTRKIDVLPLSFTTATTLTALTSSVIPYGNYSGGTVEITASAGSPTTLTWYTSADNITWVAAYDGNNTALQSTVNKNQSCPIPTQLFGAKFICASVDVACTGRVSLKG